MSTQRIGHGQTFALTGTLAGSSTLVGLSGNPGALIEVSGAATNKGVITLKGGAAAHKQGATLSDAGVLTNTGAIDVGGGMISGHAALLSIGGTLTNTGTLTAQAGTYGAGGDVLIGGGGVLRNEGTLTLAAGVAAGSLGATLTDMGVLVNRAGGVIDVQAALGPFQNGVYAYGTGGSITVAGSFTNQGLLVLYDAYRSGGSKQSAPDAAATMSVAGMLQNSGQIVVGDEGGFINVTGGALLSISGSLSNTGTVTVTGSFGLFTDTPSPGATLAVSGVLTNEGQIDLDGGGAVADYSIGGDGAQLDDSGTVDNSGTLMIGGYTGSFSPTLADARVAVDGVLTNTGVIAEQANSGIVINGSLTNEGSLSALGGVSFAYSGYYFDIGGSISVVGVLTNAAAGAITLQGGISGYPSIIIPDFPLDAFGATLSVIGTLANDGSLSLAGGSGGVPDGRSTGYDIGLGAQVGVADGGLLRNNGSIEIQQGVTSTYGVYGTGGLLTVGGDLVNISYTSASSVITIDGGAGMSTGELLITDSGRLFNDGTINGAGVLLNQGIIDTADRGSISASLINDGTVELSDSGAALEIASAISADAGKTGVLSLYGHDTLTLRGSVAASQTVAFAGGDDTLRLGHAPAFAGTLSGLAATDMIDFLKQDITSAVANGDTLTLDIAGGGSFGLALAAPLSGISLTLQSDQNGGTDLLFSAAGAGG